MDLKIKAVSHKIGNDIHLPFYAAGMCVWWIWKKFFEEFTIWT